MRRLLCSIAVLAACGGADEHIPTDARVDAPFDGAPALPDITLDRSRMRDTLRIQEISFDAESCELVEQCIGAPGLRRLLRFSTVTPNVGDGDLYVGIPEGNPHYEYSSCHGHYHFTGYADYELVDTFGTVVTGNKQAFCLLDSIRHDPDAGPGKFSCDLQGITAGWADSYAHSLPCQWIDITDVPPGLYTLRVTINPAQTFAESSYDNNMLELPVTL